MPTLIDSTATLINDTHLDQSTMMLVIPSQDPLVTPSKEPLITPSKDPLVTPSPVLKPSPESAVTRNWIAHEDAPNLGASVPENWSPTGAPQPGDTLTMHNGKMTVANNDLNGDTLDLGVANQSTYHTLNIVDQGRASLETVPDSQVNLTMNVEGGNHDINLQAQGAHITIKVGDQSDVTADTFALTYSSLDVSGGTAFLNTGVLTLHQSSLFIHDDLEGSGSIVVAAAQGGSSAEFGASVSSGQHLEIDGNPPNLSPSSATIDHPDEFGGSVSLQYGQLNLNGLMNADSYSFQNDMLTIRSGGNVIDTLALTSPPSYGGVDLALSVRQTATGVTIDNSGLSSGTMLPLVS